MVTETRTKTTFRAGVKSGPYRTATVDDVFKVRTRGDATGYDRSTCFPEYKEGHKNALP